LYLRLQLLLAVTVTTGRQAAASCARSSAEPATAVWRKRDTKAL